MARIPNIRRIRKEDFKSEDQEMVDKLASSLNNFMDETINIFDGKIDFFNLNQQIVSYRVTIDGSGNLVNPSNIKLNLKTKPAGVVCIGAQNVNSPQVYPTSQPFVSIGIVANNIINIKNITGLQNNSVYVLTLLIIGS